MKAAYLSVFALLGVEFAKANALIAVRKQIAQPDADIFRDFWLVGKETGRGIFWLFSSRQRHVAQPLGADAREHNGLARPSSVRAASRFGS